MTPQEVEYVKFLRSDTHEQKFYPPMGYAWYKRVGSNDEDRVNVLVAAQSALMEFQRNKMKGEAKYAALFLDILDHHSQWFEGILQTPYNFNLLDGLAVVLATYASLTRNRNELNTALAVLKVARLVLDIYEKRVLTRGLVHACTSTPIEQILANMHGLRYKQNGIWVNFLPQLKDAGIVYENYDTDLAHFYRAVIRYEIEFNKIEHPDSCYACGLAIRLKKRKPT